MQILYLKYRSSLLLERRLKPEPSAENAVQNGITQHIPLQHMASSSKKLVNELVLHSPHLSHPTSPRIPSFVYGTAWKKDRTSELVYQALCSGFKGVDTAAQPRHYQEHLVGDGLRRAIRENKVKREDIYVSLCGRLMVTFGLRQCWNANLLDSFKPSIHLLEVKIQRISHMTQERAFQLKSRLQSRPRCIISASATMIPSPRIPT